MESKFSHDRLLLLGTFFMFLVLQAFVVESRHAKHESPQVSNDTQGRPYAVGRTCGFGYVIGEQSSNDPGRQSSNAPESPFHLVYTYTFYNNSPKWTKFPVTWGFRSDSILPGGLTSKDATDALLLAFKVRESAVPKFAFQQISKGDDANIKVAFITFDNNTLYGFAYAPPNGTLHLNYYKSWSITTKPRIDQLDLQSGAMHEIGHTLGLRHSQDTNAVMFRSLTNGTTKRVLSQDDTDGIRILYG